MPPKSNHGQSHDRAPHAGAGGFCTHGADVSAAAHDAPKGHGLGTWTTSTGEDYLVVRPLAVSYTHLTLPTTSRV